jgi:hypothetical protein
MRPNMQTAITDRLWAGIGVILTGSILRSRWYEYTAQQRGWLVAPMVAFATQILILSTTNYNEKRRTVVVLFCKTTMLLLPCARLQVRLNRAPTGALWPDLFAAWIGEAQTCWTSSPACSTCWTGPGSLGAMCNIPLSVFCRAAAGWDTIFGPPAPAMDSLGGAAGGHPDAHLQPDRRLPVAGQCPQQP